MSRLRLYLDEDNQAHALVLGLRARMIDVVTTSDAGRIQSDDETQLAFATNEKRVLISSNVLDFPRIHAEWITASREHSGIVMVPQQRWPVGQVLARLLALHTALSAEQMRNRIEYLGSWRP